MSIHIGQSIKQKVKELRLKQEEFGKMINTTKQNVTNIFSNPDINTDRLFKVSVALKYDFFRLFSTEEPLKGMSNSEVESLQSEVKSLQQAVQQKDDKIKTLEELIESNRKVIALLEQEKENKKTSGK
jgi:transcriptional regulator with XRE-family HTH domain